MIIEVDVQPLTTVSTSLRHGNHDEFGPDAVAPNLEVTMVSSTKA